MKWGRDAHGRLRTPLWKFDGLHPVRIWPKASRPGLSSYASESLMWVVGCVQACNAVNLERGQGATVLRTGSRSDPAKRPKRFWDQGPDLDRVLTGRSKPASRAITNGSRIELDSLFRLCRIFSLCSNFRDFPPVRGECIHQRWSPLQIQGQYENSDNETRTFHNNVRIAEAPVMRDGGLAFIHNYPAQEARTKGSGSRLDSWPKLINSF